MKSIWKYVIPEALGKAVTVQMPVQANVLSVGTQRGTICIWAEVDTVSLPANRHFIVYPTGGDVTHNPDAAEFLGTVFMYQKSLVFHVYELTNVGLRGGQ